MHRRAANEAMVQVLSALDSTSTGPSRAASVMFGVPAPVRIRSGPGTPADCGTMGHTGAKHGGGCATAHHARGAASAHQPVFPFTQSEQPWHLPPHAAYT